MLRRIVVTGLIAAGAWLGWSGLAHAGSAGMQCQSQIQYGAVGAAADPDCDSAAKAVGAGAVAGAIGAGVLITISVNPDGSRTVTFDHSPKLDERVGDPVEPPHEPGDNKSDDSKRQDGVEAVAQGIKEGWKAGTQKPTQATAGEQMRGYPLDAPQGYSPELLAATAIQIGIQAGRYAMSFPSLPGWIVSIQRVLPWVP